MIPGPRAGGPGMSSCGVLPSCHVSVRVIAKPTFKFNFNAKLSHESTAAAPRAAGGGGHGDAAGVARRGAARQAAIVMTVPVTAAASESRRRH